jgi:hypothetical protein
MEARAGVHGCEHGHGGQVIGSGLGKADTARPGVVRERTSGRQIAGS